MKFVFFLMKRHSKLIIFGLLLGMVSGGANALLISVISQTLGLVGKEAPLEAGLYTFAVVLTMVSAIGSQFLLIHLSQKVTFQVRVNLGSQVLALPLRRIEALGGSRLTAAFTQDIGAVTSALMAIPALFVNASVVIGCVVYLGSLSLFVLLVLVAFSVFALVCYLLPEKLAYRQMVRMREAWDRMLGKFNALHEGAKELQLHYRRRKDFFHNHFTDSALEVRQAGYMHRAIYATLDSWNQLVYFIFLGLLFFWIPAFHRIDASTLTAYALVALYIRGPINALVGVIPTFRRSDVAFQKITRMGMKLVAEREPDALAEDPDLAALIEGRPPLSEVLVKGVKHTFHTDREEREFTLGPIDLRIKSGELVFVIGGNGSGKTTLAKLITGLYLPESGDLFFNGRKVDDANREIYRQYFSAIFSDFHLFERMLGTVGNQVDRQAELLLQRLDLAHKVTIRDGKLSTTNLSTGQRKRLALLTAYLEDREVYVFDEWASDQDPEFKKVFYYELLPDLKSRGKIVIVISHDDRFFHLADRILKLVDGKPDPEGVVEGNPLHTDATDR